MKRTSPHLDEAQQRAAALSGRASDRERRTCTPAAAAAAAPAPASRARAPRSAPGLDVRTPYVVRRGPPPREEAEAPALRLRRGPLVALVAVPAARCPYGTCKRKRIIRIGRAAVAITNSGTNSSQTRTLANTKYQIYARGRAAGRARTGAAAADATLTAVPAAAPTSRGRLFLGLVNAPQRPPRRAATAAAASTAPPARPAACVQLESHAGGHRIRGTRARTGAVGRVAAARTVMHSPIAARTVMHSPIAAGAARGKHARETPRAPLASRGLLCRRRRRGRGRRRAPLTQRAAAPRCERAAARERRGRPCAGGARQHGFAFPHRVGRTARDRAHAHRGNNKTNK